jgi:uncharacterized protein YfaS (alpha-2-macroglobulin family)
MSKQHFIILLGLLVVLLIGCQPSAQPRIIDWTPGAIDNAPLDGSIELQFDQAMDATSLGAAFHITPTVPLTITVVFNRIVGTASRSSFDSPLNTPPVPMTIARFTPQRPLAKATRYAFTLDTSARTADGQSLAAPFSAAFTTTGQLHVEVYPANGQDDVGVQSHIYLSFDASFPATMHEPLIVSPAIGGTGTWTGNRRYSFVPNGDLRPATRYTIRVPAGLQAATGEKLRNDAVAVFSTTLPEVATYLPRGSLVRPSAVISLTFNMPVVTTSVQSRFGVYQADGRQVSGKIAWSMSSTLVFTPAHSFVEGANYTVQITRGIQTPLGELASDRDFVYTFGVAPLPEMVNSNPADGDLRASIGDRISLRFNVPMDGPTVQNALHIVPAPNGQRFEWNSDNTIVEVVFEVDPAPQYLITLDNTARDVFGRSLRGNRSVVFQAAPQSPSVWLVGPRGYWNNVYGSYNPNPAVRQYTQFRNVDRLTYRLSSITRDDFLSTIQPDWYRGKNQPRSTFVVDWTQAVSAPLNTLTYASTEIALPNGLSLTPGAYLLEVTGQPGEVSDWRVLIVSPINLALKRSDKQIVVWATDLRTGQPIADLPLVIYDQQKQVVTRGRTNELGIMLTTETEHCADRWECAYGWRPLYVMTDEAAVHVSPPSAPGGPPTFQWKVGHGQAEWEWGFVASNWDEGIATRDFRLPYYYGEPSHTVFLYSDRPIYRPGQMVYFKGVIRQDNDGRFSLPKMITVPVTLRDTQGNEIYREALPISDMGTFSGEVQLADEAALGAYDIQVAYSTDEEPAHGNFRVAEYRKPEFKVTVTPAITRPVDGDVMTVTVQADYYFGAPMPNATVQWRMSSDDYYYSVPEAWYSFGDVDEYYWLWGEESDRGENLYASGSGTTDANGTFTFTIPIDLSKAKRSQVLTFEADVIDQNNQVTSARGYAVAHKSSLYVGARPRWYVTKPKELLDIQLVAADPDKQRLANVPLTVELYERIWKSVRVRDTYGVYYWRSAYSDTLISTQVVTTAADGEVTAIVLPPRGGEYRVMARGQDAQHIEAVASTFFWTWGGEYVNWGIQNDDRVNVIADKRTYQPGDTAHLLITAPFSDSIALISVERGGVLRYWTQRMPGTSALIDIPIHADYGPNAFVSVILLKGQAPDFPAADFKIGYVALNVELTQQKLNVELIPDRTRYAPRDTVAYTVRVTDYVSRPVDAEVSLSLIDAAVLALVGDEDRDILTAFYRQRGLGVHNSLTLITSVDRLTAILDKKAKGGGGGGEVETRELFADTAFWKANVRTGPTGETIVYVSLPDNLTTWRMRAKAVSADTRLGQGEVDVLATKDILLRPVLPRFFTIGDQAHIGAIVHNYTPVTQTLTVAADLAPAGGERTSLTPAKAMIGPNGSAPVYWDVIAPRALSVTVTMRAVTADGRGDAVNLTLPVNAFFEDVPYANYQPITSTQAITVALPPDVVRQFDELVIEVEPSLAASIDSGLEYLVGFPYGCVEQTMSSFLPDVVVMRLIKQLGLDLRPGFREQLGAMIESGLQRLYGYQHNDGGWGWWKDDESNPSITAYVLYGLHQMELGGRAIDARVRDNAAQYLVRWLRSTAIDAPIGSVHGAQFVSSGVNVRAFTLYVLAELGQGDPGLSGKLYEWRDKLDHYGKAFLALALYLTNDNRIDPRVEALLQELRDAAKTDGQSVYWQDKVADYYGMSTSTRTTAIAIDALTRLALSDPDLDPAVRWLMRQRQDGHWQTTQESSMSLAALTEYLAATFERDGDYVYTVRVNGQEIASVKVTPQTLGKHGKWIVPIAQLSEGDPIVEITRGDGPGASVRASVSLRHYKANDIAPIDDRGVHVSRGYSVETGKALSDLSVGDIVTVTLSVKFDQYLQYVIVEDPLPAGLEPIDTSLATTAQNPGPQSHDWRDWVWNHVELRDDRVALFATWMYYDSTLTYTYQARATTAGTFNVLPMQAYAMYKPDVIGRTAGMVVTVKRK